jgi:hypothetical protein
MLFAKQMQKKNWKTMASVLCGFWVHNHATSKAETSNHNNSQIVKGEWDWHVGVLGFRISHLEVPNTNTPQLPKSEKGKRDPHIGVFGFGTS